MPKTIALDPGVHCGASAATPSRMNRGLVSPVPLWPITKAPAMLPLAGAEPTKRSPALSKDAIIEVATSSNLGFLPQRCVQLPGGPSRTLWKTTRLPSFDHEAERMAPLGPGRP